MITVCPSCQRQFRIYARQLSAAGGQVQCGFCGQQFNALKRLYDQPLANGLHEEPRDKIPESVTDSELAGPDIMPVSAATGQGKRPVRGETEAYLADDLLLPEPPQHSPTGTVLWTLGSCFLLLVITAQLIWFNRDRLLARYPDYMPQVKRLCERYGCEPVRERDLDAIVLVNRDVRDHPRYNDMLLVNITIENRSDRTQPYPGIQFMLFESNGLMTGFRRLQPAEYLDPGTAIDAGMPPHMPLHLVLEVAETSGKPVGFEFGFFY